MELGYKFVLDHSRAHTLAQYLSWPCFHAGSNIDTALWKLGHVCDNMNCPLSSVLGWVLAPKLSFIVLCSIDMISRLTELK